MARGFDGATSSRKIDVAIGTGGSRRPVNQVTLCYWFYRLGAGENWNRPVSKIRTDGSERAAYSIQQSAGTAQYVGRINTDSGGEPAGGTSSGATGAINNNVWYFFMFRWLSGEAPKVIIYNANGTIFTESPSPATVGGSIDYGTEGTFTIGEDQELFNCNGRVAEIRVFDIKLNDSQVRSVQYNRPISVKPVVYMPLWGLDNPEPDLAGFGGTVTHTNAPTKENHPPVGLYYITDFAYNDLFLEPLKQYARPASDIVTAGWETSPTPGQALYAQVDEEISDDNDYIFNTL